MNKEFIEIGTKTGTDKIYQHGYDRFYPDYIKRDIKKLLEIGVAEYAGINLWLEYCPDAFIYGFDIKTECDKFRLKVIKGDQAVENDLDRLINVIGKDIDVIVDDGSHVPQHQLFAFIKLFPLVKNGGIYIIEDIESSYWKYNKLLYDTYPMNNGIEAPFNLINVFQKVLHLLNREFFYKDDKDKAYNNLIIPVELVDAISTVTFAQNCIIIKKKSEYEYKYNNRVYGHY